MPQDLSPFQQQFPQSFQQALAQQQEKKWDDALSKYKAILDQGHNAITNEQASVVYHNMAIIAVQNSDTVSAYIWSNKARTLNSTNSFANSLFAEVSKKFQPAQIPHQISTIESLQKIGLKNISFDFLFIGFLIFFLMSLFISLKIWLIRRKNKIESESLSLEKKHAVSIWFSLSGLILTTGLFLFLSMIKWSDISIPKALVSVDKTAVQTASGGNQATIFEASAGLEVEILKTNSDYVQIRYPGGFSGWVPKKNLELLTSPNWP